MLAFRLDTKAISRAKSRPESPDPSARPLPTDIAYPPGTRPLRLYYAHGRADRFHIGLARRIGAARPDRRRRAPFSNRPAVLISLRAGGAIARLSLPRLLRIHSEMAKATGISRDVVVMHDRS